MTFEKASHFEQQRALMIHAEFMAALRSIESGSATQDEALQLACKRIHGTVVEIPTPKGKRTKERTISFAWETARKSFAKWRKSGKQISSLVRDYKPGKPKVPQQLVSEIRRLSTEETGGRNKHSLPELSTVYQWLCDDWNADKEIPGLGTRSDWYAREHPTEPLPDFSRDGIDGIRIDFPYSLRTVTKYGRSTGKELRKLGSRGKAAAMENGYAIPMNHASLKRCQLYTLDDVRLDIAVLDPDLGHAITCRAYLMMECASRAIVSWICKPRDALKNSDVREILAHGLRHGGIGMDYTTHVLLERGTCAMTEAEAAAIEGLTNGRVKIHQTSVREGMRFAGAYSDAGSGNSRGKALIESFMRQFHKRLLRLAGQRGTNYKNQPAFLGFVADGEDQPGTAARAARQLAEFELNMAEEGQRLNLSMPLLRFGELIKEIAKAVDAHNDEAGHDYAGHGTHWEEEVQPGVWQDVGVNDRNSVESNA